MTPEYHLDFETRSRADLKKVGAHRYARDPSTRILMFSISSTAHPEPVLWVPPEYESPELLSHPRAKDMLAEAVASGALVWAHNAEFERAVAYARLLVDVGLQPPKVEQLRCTAALARKLSLPASLAGIGDALNLGQQKWTAGSALIRHFSMPCKDDGEFNSPGDPANWEKFAQFGRYCCLDNTAEVAVYKALTSVQLQGLALDTFLFDARLNDRGIPVNVPALNRAYGIITEVQADVTAEFQQLTGLNPTQRNKVKALLDLYGISLPDMTAKTLEDTLDDDDLWAELDTLDISGDAKRVIELYKQVSYAAIKKVKSMLDCVCEDGRVRGCFVYHGAGTGRWAARLIQPQNFKRPTIPDTALAYDLICNGCSADDLAVLWGNPLEVIASCIRHFIQLPDGQEMLDADYSSVEARIVNWLAGQEDALNVYRRADTWAGPKKDKPDPYVNMARIIFGKTTISKDERWVGKQAELGCGFGMGKAKFFAQCLRLSKTYGIKGVVVTEDLAALSVGAYRKMHYKVRELWYDMDNAARAAIAAPGGTFTAGKCAFAMKKVASVPFLVMTLPSGRNLFYPHPKIEIMKVHEEDLEGDKCITFYGQLPSSTQWGRVKTWGGTFAENATQAVAADLMAGGALESERVGIEPFALIHDQALAPRKPGQTAEQFCTALTRLPAWAVGLPLSAEGKEVPYYLKL